MSLLSTLFTSTKPPIRLMKTQFTNPDLGLLDRETSSSGYTGNPYTEYNSKVSALSKKFEGAARWGCELIQTIVAVRASFAIGQGIRPVARVKGTDRELKYIKEFIIHNGLHEGVPLEYAEEAEIEGKTLLRLFPNKEAKQIEIRAVPWSQHAYTIKVSDDDYMEHLSAKYMVSKTGKEVNLTPDEFVYAIFGGRVYNVNKPTPPVSKVLWKVEALSKALWDWRQINHIIGLPTPVFKCENSAEVDEVFEQLEDHKWKIGDILVTTANFKIEGIDFTKIETIRQEITTLAKMISGDTSVPVHFLGMPDLLSNRATADNLLELVSSGTAGIRKTWRGVWDKVFNKVIAMANKEFPGLGGMREGVIGVEIPQTSSARIKEIESIWLPLYERGAITLETLLSKVPEIDADEEAKAVHALEKDRATALLAEIKAQEDTESTSKDDEQ